MLVHEDGLFGTGLAKLMQAELPKRGFEILDSIAHPTPARDMSNVALQISAKNPDLVIPSSYYGEFVLLARTMQQQHIRPKGVYCVLNGAASNYRFVKEFPEAAQYVMDSNHWFDPRKEAAHEAQERGRGMRASSSPTMSRSTIPTCCCSPTPSSARLRRTRKAITAAHRLLDLRRPHHALWPDAVRQGPEHGRGAGQHAGAGRATSR